jgi:hypothetical protein
LQLCRAQDFAAEMPAQILCGAQIDLAVAEQWHKRQFDFRQAKQSRLFPGANSTSRSTSLSGRLVPFSAELNSDRGEFGSGGTAPPARQRRTSTCLSCELSRGAKNCRRTFYTFAMDFSALACWQPGQFEFAAE